MKNEKSMQLLQLLAAQNVCDGVLYEPRVYFDLFDTYVNGIQQSEPGIFRNGEDYPVRITHLVAAMKTGSDERLVQRYGLRVLSHDSYYMNSLFAPLPLWHNTRVAASDIITTSQSSWKFWKPFYMAARDVLEVRLAMEEAISANDEERRISISLNGVGAISRRPKQITAYRDVLEADGTTTLAFDSDELKNDGLEPLEIHEVVLNIGGPLGGAATGNIRLARFSMRLVGNGTNQRWTIGPDGSLDDLCPATLFGATTGRAIVHTLPTGQDGHPGWLWLPGMGVDLQVQNFLEAEEQAVYVGLLGHAIIK